MFIKSDIQRYGYALGLGYEDEVSLLIEGDAYEYASDTSLRGVVLGNFSLIVGNGPFFEDYRTTKYLQRTNSGFDGEEEFKWSCWGSLFVDYLFNWYDVEYDNGIE